MAAPIAGVSRKAQALAYISDYIVRYGRSPVMREIAQHLGVSDTRAKALVKLLAHDKMVERLPGSQRGISVPGLLEKHLLERIRELGIVVNDDFIHPLRTLPLPQGNLPIVAVIQHMPKDDPSQSPA